MIDLFRSMNKTDGNAGLRVKSWVRELFGLPEDTTVAVSELRCSDPDCPDVETVIAVLGEPGVARRHKIFKPIGEILREDVADLAARGTHG